MADESETMSATLRFPFQASLDGSALVETDGNLYYGLDTSHGFAELPAEVDSTTTPNSESDSQSGLGLGIDLDGDDCEERQQKQQLNSNIMAHPPRWDSLRKDQELEEATPRPASLPVHPHRINTSDQQRFATEHEMTAAEEEVEAEEDTICESPSLSTLEETVTVTQTQTQTTIRLPVPLSGQLPRYYATPLTKDDPTSTPVALYGLEKPSDHVPRKKAPAVLRQRGSNPVAASVRPSSRHLHQPSPLSSTVSPDDRVVEEPSRSSTSSTRRLSMFLGRTSYPTAVPSTGVTRPAIGSISSSGSSATTSTTRSAVTTASETSTASSISTSTFSPPPATTLDTNQKSASDPASNLPKRNSIPTSTTTSTLDHQTRSSSFSQPLRRKTSPINSTTEPTSMSREKSRRSSIFHFSKPKLSPMVHLRAGIQSSENLSTIRAVTNDQGTPTNNNNTYPFNDPLLESSSMSPSSSKQMPFSPDSFVSPHTQPYTTNPPDNHEYNNTNSFSQVNRPHTSHHTHDHRPNTTTPTSNAEEGYRTSTTNDQSQARKLKKSDHHHQNHQNRATKLFTKILI